MPYLSSLGLHQYFAAQGSDPSMTEPFASAMLPPEMLAAQLFCLAGYNILSFSIDDIANPREFFAEQGVLYRFVRCFFKSFVAYICHRLEQESLNRQENLCLVEEQSSNPFWACRSGWKHKLGRVFSRV